MKPNDWFMYLALLGGSVAMIAGLFFAARAVGFGWRGTVIRSWWVLVILSAWGGVLLATAAVAFVVAIPWLLS